MSGYIADNNLFSDRVVQELVNSGIISQEQSEEAVLIVSDLAWVYGVSSWCLDDVDMALNNAAQWHEGREEAVKLSLERRQEIFERFRGNLDDSAGNDQLETCVSEYLDELTEEDWEEIRNEYEQQQESQK